jgi:hypothetical protein
VWVRTLTIDLDGVHTMGNFEVIEIVHGTTPYPTLLGLDWEFDNHGHNKLEDKEIECLNQVNIESLCNIVSFRRRKVCRTHLLKSRGNKPDVQNHRARRRLC